MSSGRLQPSAPANRNPHPWSATDVLVAISAASDVPPSEIIGRYRRTEYVMTRHLLVYFLRHHLGWGVRQISRQIGRSPATIWQSCLEGEALMRYDRHFIRLYSAALTILGHPHGCKPLVHDTQF